VHEAPGGFECRVGLHGGFYPALDGGFKAMILLGAQLQVELVLG